MIRGEKRNQIMENCPEEFKDQLKDFIDDIEFASAEIVNALNISSLEDLSKIEEAFNLADNLANSLY